ncbi:MAG TPA: hypothetical protein VGC14_25075 [Rhizobium sp.]
MKILATALVALAIVVLPATYAEARDYHHRHHVMVMHHGHHYQGHTWHHHRPMHHQKPHFSHS